MKGIVFNLLEEIVRQEQGEEAWDALLEAAEVDGIYTSLGSYDDDELMKLVMAAASAGQASPDDILRWFGRRALPLLAHRFPKFFDAHDSTRPFMLTLNDIIHAEVRKLYPGADVPVFEFDASREQVLTVGYTSARRMCAFATGLVEGAAAYFGEVANLEQPRCMGRGDGACVLKISFTKPPPSP